MGAAAIPAALVGGQLLSSQLQAKAEKRASKSQKDEIHTNVRKALEALSPEQIGQLVQQFLPQIQAILNPLQQTAIAGTREQAARQFGDAASPISLSQEAGVRGQFGNLAATQAFQQAMQVAQQRAGIFSGAPIPQASTANLGQGINNALGSYLGYRALTTNPQTTAASRSVFNNMPGTPNFYGPQMNPYLQPKPPNPFIVGPAYQPSGGYRA